MKKRFYLIFCILILFVLSLLSCPQKATGNRKVTFMSFNKESNKYEQLNEVDVLVNTTFENVAKTINVLPIEEYENYNYTHSHWTSKRPKDGEINTTNKEYPSTSTISSNLTVYSVYEKRNIVTLKCFVQQGEEGNYKTLEEDKFVAPDTPLRDIERYKTPSVIDNYKGSKYTFKHWTEETPEENVPKITSEDKVEEDTLIEDNITLYAVYKKEDNKYTVTFNAFDPISKAYIQKTTVPNVPYGASFSSIKPTTDDIINYQGHNYTYTHWTKTSATGTTPNTSGADFGDNTQITEDITLYAVYQDGGENKYTVTFKEFNTVSKGYTKEIKNTEVDYLTPLNSIAPTPVKIEYYDGYKYTYKHWTKTSATGTTPNTSGTDFGDNTQITEDVTLYVVYQRSEMKVVTFKSFDNIRKSYVEQITNYVSPGTTFESVKPTTDPTEVIIKGVKYSFVGWADKTSSTTILEEYNNTDYQGSTPITENKEFCAIYKGDYLEFTAVQNTDVSFNRVGNVPSNQLQYRKSTDSDFKNYVWESIINLTPNEKVYFRGYGSNTFSININNYINFTSTGNVNAAGSVMSLANSDTIQYAEIPSQNYFTCLFKDCTTLLTPPSLPATRLKGSCYQSMFEGCTSLVEAPELPATTLADSCYYSMFKDCTSITSSPRLNAEMSTEGYFYAKMFSGCSNLRTAGALSLKILSSYCCYQMFKDCTSLTSTPSLPATTLVLGCYEEMFSGCTSLNEVKSCDATDISAEDCTKNWLLGVPSTGIFNCKSGANWKTDHPDGIPIGWTKRES